MDGGSDRKSGLRPRCLYGSIYLSKVKGPRNPTAGYGVLWEATLIYQCLYDAGTRNEKFIPVLFENGARAHIPKPLRPFAYHKLILPKDTTACTGD